MLKSKETIVREEIPQQLKSGIQNYNENYDKRIPLHSFRSEYFSSPYGEQSQRKNVANDSLNQDLNVPAFMRRLQD